MRVVLGRRPIGLVMAGVAAVVLLAAPTVGAERPSDASTASGAAQKRAAQAHLSVRAVGLRKGRLGVGHRSRAVGYLRPFVQGQRVRIALMHRGRVISKRNPVVKRVHNTDKGRFALRSPGLIKPGSYRVVAKHFATPVQDKATARSAKFRLKYPNLGRRDHNVDVRLFNRLLVKQGYFTTHGKSYSAKTGLAVMAFRKVNGMHRSFNATPGIFKKLAAGRGAFRLHHPGAGKHVEVDISKQVMVLANHREPQHTFHVSTGAPATPTIRGHYRFYMRQPGFNSHGMYYSVYFRGGYAIHGYRSVPPFPASHGCVRNPIPESKFIYDWVKLGMSIYTYG
jgi:lipoprotein-anchoring transpeptidase ErfK/SrfK